MLVSVAEEHFIGVTFVELGIFLEPDVYRVLRSLWKYPREKRQIMPFSNILAVSSVLLPSDNSFLSLTLDARQHFSSKTLSKGCPFSLSTFSGTVELIVEKLVLQKNSKFNRVEVESGVVYDITQCEFQVQLHISHEITRDTLGSLTSKIISDQTQLSGDYIQFVEHVDDISMLLNRLLGDSMHHSQSFEQFIAPNPLEVFALVGESGTGKTMGVQRFSRILSELWKKHDNILFIIHISIYDLIPHADALGLLEHMEILSKNLSTALHTARLARPFFLVIDDMQLISQELCTPYEPFEECGPYHPLLKNYLLHAINAFIDEEKTSDSEFLSHLVLVFQHHDDVPSALKGPNRIFHVLDTEAPTLNNEPWSRVKMFLQPITSMACTAIPSETINECLKISMNTYNQVNDERIEEKKNGYFLRQVLHHKYGLTCFCCSCIGLRANCEKLNSCCINCCWIECLSLFTRGWNKSELMSLVGKGATKERWNIKSAIQHAISYISLSIRHQVYPALKNVIASEAQSTLVDFIDSSSAWRKINLMLLLPLKAVLSSKKRVSDLYVPKGMLIHGDNGTGKTALLNALEQKFQQKNFIDFSLCPNDQAGNTETLPYIRTLRVDATRIISKYFGESEANLVALFHLARKLRPCIILADHIEHIIGVSREISEESNYDERLLSTFLTEMSGFSSDEEQGKPPVVVIGVTQNMKTLDPAALRAGRLELHVSLNIGIDEDEAFKILTYFIQKMPNKVHSDSLRFASQYLVKHTLVIGTIQQFCQQLAWKALSRGSKIIENDDILAVVNTNMA